MPASTSGYHEPEVGTHAAPMIASTSTRSGVTNTRSNPGMTSRPEKILPSRLNEGVRPALYLARRRSAAKKATTGMASDSGGSLNATIAQYVHHPTNRALTKAALAETG